MDKKVLEWIADYTAGTIHPEDAGRLREWIDECAENREAFERYLRMVKTHRMIEGERMICDDKAWEGIYHKLRQSKRKQLMRRISAVAASVLILISVGVAVRLQYQEPERIQPVTQILPGMTKATLVLANGSQVDLTRDDLTEIKEQEIRIKNDTSSGLQYELADLKVEEPVFHRIQVPVAGEYHFTLPDGTKVWVNSASELRFPVAFVGDQREVYVKGEVYFEVEPDAEHPFVVHANDVAVRVLGTKFNVAAYEESSEVVTTLAEGRVEVEYAGQKEELLPGFQAIAHKQRGNIVAAQVDAGMYTSWIHGIFEYENMPLSEIAVQLSRWYDVNFIFSAPEFKDRRFTGVVKKYETLNELLKIIEKTTNVSFMIDERNIAVKSDRR